MKSDEKKMSESYRLVCEENKEVMEVSGLWNAYVKLQNPFELKCWMNEHWFTIVNLMQRWWLLLLLLLTAIELSLSDSSPYTSTDKTNKNKYA
jgi:hypothetical protein